MTTELLTNGHRDELAAIQAAYEALQRRDGSAERRAWQWQCVVWGLLVLVGILSLGLLWLMYQRTQIRAFVQVVQVNDDGKVVNLGVPQDLMSYEPADEHWRDMLTHWVLYRRWHSGEPVVTKRDWAWVYAHTCGEARRLLGQDEAKEKPFDEKRKQVSVQVESITKSPAPLNYQVLWRERTVDPSTTASEKAYTGTFVVSRYRPPTEAALLTNRLGLCVSAFDLSLRP